ncbi:hypothetical protein HKBW3S47_02427 [Candidatus Hakubella thermalkaliphila]|uniref:Uncharacterized protein n=1 Tax=Candidatus Hakubella thermalkaliphila TaxID=2754717 RepID=A0A6V8Q8H4_9ACTN|nr:hypothetical protein HKBW3S47_02427 [Candidatus Hakubella thermalkaliphila]
MNEVAATAGYFVSRLDGKKILLEQLEENLEKLF